VLGAGAAALPQKGEYDSREVFAELIVPLIEDRPFFHSLTLEAGARYSDYSTSGGNWTYKVGGSWEPIPDVKLRSVYSRAVRAPNLAELFQPQVVALSNLTVDPCQGTAAQIEARAAGLTALCIATGVPAGAIGNIPPPSSGQIQTTQGGNLNLGPEVAKTFTAGIVLQPRMVPGLAVTFDYYNIDIDKAISTPTVPDIINGCYTPAQNPGLSTAAPACALILRNKTTGRLDGEAVSTPGVQLAFSNAGFLQTRGYDLSVSYRRDLGFARMNLAFNGNLTERARFQASTAASFIRECLGFYSGSCQPIQPRHSWTLRSTLSWAGDIDTSLLWRHISSARLEPRQGPAGEVCPNVGEVGSCGPGAAAIFDAYENIPAYDYFDFSLRAGIADNMTFIFTVANLLDKQPPFVGNTIGATAFNGGNTFPSNYDPVGRRYNVGVNLRF
jgi:outer membrane receptor protein involved in Fe transport